MSESGKATHCCLDGLIAVVTGAAQGLGLGIAEQLAINGATVIIADLQADKAEIEANQLQKNGLCVNGAYLDVTDSKGVTAFFNGVVNDYNHLDILVNNAGIGQNVTPVVELSDAEWARVLDVTLTGTFYCCRAASKIMERQESGSIVNLASIAADLSADVILEDFVACEFSDCVLAEYLGDAELEFDVHLGEVTIDFLLCNLIHTTNQEFIFLA